MAFTAAMCVLGLMSAHQTVPIPRLVPQPVPPSLQVLDFRMQRLPAAALTSSGTIILVDVDQTQIVSANLHTGAIVRYGKKGSGPREFPNIFEVGVSPKGQVVALSADRLTVLSSNLAFINSIRITKSVSQIAKVTNDSVYLLGGSYDSVYAVSVRSGAMRPVANLSAEIERGFRGKAEYQRGFWVSPRSNGGWYLAGPYSPGIVVTNPGGIVERRIERSSVPEYPNAAQLRETRATMAAANPGKDLSRFMKTAAETPNPFTRSPVSEDGESRVWVQTSHMTNDSTEVEVYSQAGAKLGSVRISGGVLRLLVQGHEAVAITKSLAESSAGDIGLQYFKIQ